MFQGVLFYFNLQFKQCLKKIMMSNFSESGNQPAGKT